MARRDWDDDDDRPRRRRPRDDDVSRPPRQGGSAFPIKIAIAGAAGLLLLVAAGALAYFLGVVPARVATGPVAGTPEEEAKDHVVRVRVSASPQQILFGGTESGHAAVVS